MKKRVVSIVLMLLMVAMLVACGDKGGSSAAPKTEAPKTEVKTDAPKTDAPDSTVGDETTAVEPNETEAPNDEPQGKTGFKVSGTKLLDVNGNEFVMRGINHAHAWFNSFDETAIKAIAATGSNTVRIVCADGQQWRRDTAESLTKIIDLCKENKLICVLEVHDATGYDDLSSINKAVQFWKDVKSALIGNEDYVIVNIANEWMGAWDTETWVKGYTKGIAELREAGIKNTIMVDAGGWGQYAQCIAEGGTTVLEADPEANTMFSVHFYGTAGGTPEKIEKALTGATDNELCVIVGEFGFDHTDGDVDEAYIMKYCTEQSIGYIGWSWKGNSEDVAYLDLAIDWEGTELSENWGEVLINGENGIKETSKICSVY